MTTITINPRADVHPIPPAPIVYADIPTNLETLPFSGDLAQIVNENAIARSLKNIVLSVPYQRPYNPIGTNITSSLFEPFSVVPADILSGQISAAIKLHEPRVLLNSVIVNQNVDQNSMEVIVNWTALWNKQIFITNVILERNR